MGSRAREVVRGEGGGVIIMWTLGMVGFLGFLAVVAEAGFFVMERTELQRTADAAALAGAQDLPYDPAGGTTAAGDWADKNTAALAMNDVVLANGNTQITSTVGRERTQLFTGVLDVGNHDVQADATARIASPALPGIGVSPLAVPLVTYMDPLVQGGLPFTLKTAAGQSNTGLVRIGTGNQGTNYIEDALIHGADEPLTPQIATETGNNTNKVLNGLASRLQAALGTGCYTYAAVMSSVNGSDWPCGPFQAAESDGGGVQATAVILIPIVVQNFPNQQGNQTVDVHRPDPDGPYELAYFWVDGNATFADPLNGDWSCKNGPPSKCEIQGRFLFNMPAYLSTPGSGDEIVDYDSNGVVRVVQLIE